MDTLDRAYDEMRKASGLAAVMNAAHAAFMAMLPVIVDQQDRGGHAFLAYVMAGASAASGRFAVALAPSFAAASAGPVHVHGDRAVAASSQAAARTMARLSDLVAQWLDDAALLAADAADRQACADAARHGHVRVGSYQAP